MHQHDLHEHLHLPHWRLTGLHALFATATLRTFAYSLVGIFGPIFIYQFNESISQVLVFELLYQGMVIVSTYPIVKQLPRLGFARSMLFGNLLFALYVVLLGFSTTNENLIYSAAIVAGIMVPFYWVPYHTIFSLDGIDDHLGEEIGAAEILDRLASVAGPLLGGVLIVTFGFRATFFIAAALLSLSAAPMLLLKQKFPQLEVPSFAEAVSYFKGGKFKDNLLGFASIGAESKVQAVAWPLFLFLFVGGVEVIGGLTTLVLLLSLVTTWLIGRWVDKKGAGDVLGLGALGNGVVWVLKIVAQSIGLAFVVDSAYRLSKTAMIIPFDKLFYEKARNEKLKFMIAREWAINGGRFLTLLTLLVLVWLGVNWLVAFVIAAVASLGTVYLARE